MNKRMMWFSMILAVLLPPVASSGERKEENCSFYNAQYHPALGSVQESDKFSYFITVRDNQNKERDAPRYFLKLTISEKKLNKKVTSVEIPYVCVGMSVRRCYLKLSDNKFDIAYLTTLNRDFSVNSISRKTPYALVIPQSAAIFHSVRWNEVETIKYLTSPPVNPDFRVPSIWTFDKCMK